MNAPVRRGEERRATIEPCLLHHLCQITLQLQFFGVEASYSCCPRTLDRGVRLICINTDIHRPCLCRRDAVYKLYVAGHKSHSTWASALTMALGFDRWNVIIYAEQLLGVFLSKYIFTSWTLAPSSAES